MLRIQRLQDLWQFHSNVHGRCESVGSVCKPGPAGSIIEVARIEGKIFKTIKETEAHGLELAKEWVDERGSEI